MEDKNDGFDHIRQLVTVIREEHDRLGEQGLLERAPDDPIGDTEYGLPEDIKRELMLLAMSPVDNIIWVRRKREYDEDFSNPRMWFAEDVATEEGFYAVDAREAVDGLFRVDLLNHLRG